MALATIDEIKIKKEINNLNKLIKIIERAGGELPGLKTALNRLEFCIDTGIDMVDAARQTADQLQQYREKLLAECRGDVSCEIYVRGQYQKLSVDALTGDLGNTSTGKLFLINTVQRYAPKVVCDHLEFCARKANAQ
ncbi:hypothetical protein [Psychromonas antarctica]|uniref:hypothetical protein n=1 Tax=Psychromonas antarctica TaxID=67573 RepID=UPI001EE7B7AA|nr:hypothetical protein [Psychromonas antarctica]MCG6202657.1 hypothetical protein [Psychromonas antarctica]